MNDEEILQMYIDIGKAINNHQLEHILIAMGNIIADLSLRSDMSVIRLLSVVTQVAIENSSALKEQRDEERH